MQNVHPFSANEESRHAMREEDLERVYAVIERIWRDDLDIHATTAHTSGRNPSPDFRPGATAGQISHMLQIDRASVEAIMTVLAGHGRLNLGWSRIPIGRKVVHALTAYEPETPDVAMIAVNDIMVTLPPSMFAARHEHLTVVA
jgi:hypothetical protein